MTLSVCDQVAERVALGEPLGEVAEHAEGCASCKDLIAMSSKLGATRHAVDPGLGFTARMTVGAQHRIAARRRQRLAVGLAATVVSGAFGVFLVTRTPSVTPPVVDPGPLVRTPPAPDPWNTESETPPTDEDADLAMLVDYSDVERSARVSANWKHITRPLGAYKRLVKDAETP
ncbi:MAG TPA: hypothetical protein VLM79_07570 [Kofleriaceae bacterium]|nr:hypothetical protein [Kofleriaceae bacterium]